MQVNFINVFLNLLFLVKWKSFNKHKNILMKKNWIHLVSFRGWKEGYNDNAGSVL